MLIAVIVFTPEAISALRAALDNQLQRSINLCLGASASTIGLTVPAILGIGIATGTPMVLGLDATGMTLLVLTLLLSTGVEFCLTHCYTGYPMVRRARAMVRSGVIGSIRQVHVQYVQGYLASEDVPPGWRLDPMRIGGSMILIDIGTHAHHLAGYVTGLDLESLCADVGHVVPRRKVDDYASLLLRYSNGARGSMWVTNAASGAEHGLCFRIFGELGGLQWHQEEPNRLIHCKREGFEESLTRRKDSLVSEAARRVTRVEIGHPEGYLEAFANLYSDFAKAVIARLRQEPSDQNERDFPAVEDGVKGLAFVEAAIQSSASQKWQTVEVPSVLRSAS